MPKLEERYFESNYTSNLAEPISEAFELEQRIFSNGLNSLLEDLLNAQQPYVVMTTQAVSW